MANVIKGSSVTTWCMARESGRGNRRLSEDFGKTTSSSAYLTDIFFYQVFRVTKGRPTFAYLFKRVGIWCGLSLNSKAFKNGKLLMM